MPMIKIVRLAKDLPLPAYQTPGSAGMDLYASISPHTFIVIHPGERRHVPAGFRMEIPPGYEAQVRGRSGLRLRHGIVVPMGTIDSDYRGEVATILFNLGNRYYRINHGDRIAQLVIAPVACAQWQEVEDLAESGRGESGFGSTGVK